MSKALFCVLNILLSLNGGDEGVYIVLGDEGVSRGIVGITWAKLAASHRGPVCMG